MTLRPLRRYFKARKGKPELELKFYPEGGNLITGTDCNVALELNTEEGEHLENVEFDILDPQGKKITKTRTGNRGRCTFILHDVASEEGYKAVFQYKGYDYEVKLPEVEEEGIALRRCVISSEAGLAPSGSPAFQHCCRLCAVRSTRCIM